MSEGSTEQPWGKGGNPPAASGNAGGPYWTTVAPHNAPPPQTQVGPTPQYPSAAYAQPALPSYGPRPYQPPTTPKPRRKRGKLWSALGTAVALIVVALLRTAL